MGCVNSTLKQKKLKRSIDSKKNIDSESDKNIINPIEEDYDSDDSIDRLSIDDFVEEYVRQYKKYFYPWVKGRSPPIKVTLKILPSSINKARDLLNELKTHYKNAKSSDPISFYGITYVEQIEKFMIVIEHFDYGDLRTYLKSNFSDLKWKTKINLLDSTARGW
ncbi:5964_t:CDS:2 [Scutellospora calospora]|uniref:5964_t:CDS:1 n=1 Tax=Scutellospora calospora TaxID=85575 RepID=A0ACA9MED0_9GLOM|nr:5964_t:CDS:2 [Scutellospora calospora]